MWALLNLYAAKNKGSILISLLLYFSMYCFPAMATDAPVVNAGRVTTAVAGTSYTVPVTVANFNNIGQFTLTMNFDTTKVRFVSATTTASLAGMSVVYTHPSGNTQGTLVLNWIGAANLSLPDSSVISNLTFTYVSYTGILTWAYTYGAVCQFQTYVGGVLTAMNDAPQYNFYKNGGISNRSAPITYAPTIVNPVPGSMPLLIKVSGFTNIGALTLYLEYDSTCIKYNNTFWKKAGFNSSFLVGDNPATGKYKHIVIHWYSSTALSIAGGALDSLCILNFTYLNGNNIMPLNWYDIGPSLEYADNLGNVLIDMPTANYFKNGSIGVPLESIFLRKTTNCGEFNVKLKSPVNLQGNLTKVTFTVKWAATANSDVQLTNVVSAWPGLQQSSRVLYNGYYYVTFQSQTSYPVSWTAGTENTIVTFCNSGNGLGTADFTIIPTDYNTVAPGVNTAYYLEVSSTNATGSITNDAAGVALSCGLYLKDFLQGPYNTSTHLMNTNLAAGNYLPLSQPYNVSPWLYLGSEHVASYPAGVVDWVLVELRTGTAANTVVGRRAGLLKSDGTILDTNGISPLVFHTFVPGNSYYVVIYHRNHLPVMTATALSLPNTSATKRDFTTSPTGNLYSTTNDASILLETGVYGQIAGDINNDNKLKYTGTSNDRDLILTRINNLYTPPPATLNSTVKGYYAEDLNLDGTVKYSGPQNDQAIIIANIDALTNPTTISSIYQGQVPLTYAAKALNLPLQQIINNGFLLNKLNFLNSSK